jgi:hypothetical protein
MNRNVLEKRAHFHLFEITQKREKSFYLLGINLIVWRSFSISNFRRDRLEDATHRARSNSSGMLSESDRFLFLLENR